MTSTVPAAPSATPTPIAPARGVGPSVRRVIVFGLLFTMVVIAAIGVTTLLTRLIDVANYRLAASDTAGLALALAFSLVAGPLALLLWWAAWRPLRAPGERSALAWGLYLAGMSTVALISAATGLLLAATSLIRSTWDPGSLASGLAWSVVWLWHRWMSTRLDRSPTRLATIAAVLGSLFGLTIGIGGVVSALGALFERALTGFTSRAELSTDWWPPVVRALVWVAGGAVIWWWFWIHDDARSRFRGLGAVVVVYVAGLAAVTLALGGIATALFIILRAIFDPSAVANEPLGGLGMSIAAAGAGSVVWLYYRAVVRQAPDGVRAAVRLVTSGVTVAASASGVGVVVNAILAALGSTLADGATRTLLLGGISALVVGGPAWWLSWRPTRSVTSTESGTTGRRVFLIAIFGVSAVVALITLLVIGYRIFAFTLDHTAAQNLLDQVRAPLGLLLATGLAAGYHFAVWRRDRAVAPPAVPTRTIGQIILIAAGRDADASRLALERITGARVTVWARQGVTAVHEHAPTVEPAADRAAKLASALEGIVAARVVVIVGDPGTIEVIPLAD